MPLRFVFDFLRLFFVGCLSEIPISFSAALVAPYMADPVFMSNAPVGGIDWPQESGSASPQLLKGPDVSVKYAPPIPSSTGDVATCSTALMPAAEFA